MSEQKKDLKRKLEESMGKSDLDTNEPKTKKQKLDDELKILDVRFSNDVYHSKEEVNAAVDNVVEAIQLSAPVRISLRANNIDDSHLIKIDNALENNTSVTYLDVGENEFTTEGVRSLIRLFTQNKTLKTLIFEDIQGMTIEMRALVPLLANNSTLTVLNIGNGDLDLKDDFKIPEPEDGIYCGIGEIGMGVLWGILLTNTTLQELNLNRNSLTGHSISYLEEILKTNKALEKLSLFGNHIDNEGVKKIADGLLCNTHLKELDLSGNDIGNEGIDALMTMLKTNITIRKINLQRNPKIDEKKLKELEEVLHARTCNNLKANCQSVSIVLLHKNGIFKEPVIPKDIVKKILFLTEDLDEEHSTPIVNQHLKMS